MPITDFDVQDPVAVRLTDDDRRALMAIFPKGTWTAPNDEDRLWFPVEDALRRFVVQYRQEKQATPKAETRQRLVDRKSVV